MWIKILSFVLISSFYIAYFTKQIILKKRGIQTNRLAKGQKSKQTTKIETALLITTYFMALLQYIDIFFGEKIFSFVLPNAIRYLGLVVMALGVIFFLLAIITMRDNWRAGIDENQKTSFVCSGIYRYSRNPAFVGFDFLYIGSILALPNYLLLIATIIAIVLFHFQILQEELFLDGKFGVEYAKYKKNTARYIFF